MGAFYGNKIRNGENNQKTDEAWRLEDVPFYWRSKVEKWIQEN